MGVGQGGAAERVEIAVSDDERVSVGMGGRGLGGVVLVPANGGRGCGEGSGREGCVADPLPPPPPPLVLELVSSWYPSLRKPGTSCCKTSRLNNPVKSFTLELPMKPFTNGSSPPSRGYGQKLVEM